MMLLLVVPTQTACKVSSDGRTRGLPDTAGVLKHMSAALFCTRPAIADREQHPYAQLQSLAGRSQHLQVGGH